MKRLNNVVFALATTLSGAINGRTRKPDRSGSDALTSSANATIHWGEEAVPVVLALVRWR